MASEAFAQLAAEILGADTQKLIAQENPYYQFMPVPQAFTTSVMSYQPKDSKELWQQAGAASIGAALGGALEGFGSRHQTTLTDRYNNALYGALLGDTANSQKLAPSLFQRATRMADVYRMSQLQELIEQQRDIEKAGMVKNQELSAEDAFWKRQAGAGVPVPQVRAELGAGTPAVVAEVPGKTPPVAVPMGNPKNPYYQEDVRKQERERDIIMRLEKETYDRIRNLPVTASFADIDANFKTLVALAKEDSRPASIGMISALARVWDPQGTVREGEFALNANAQSALDQIVGDWRQLVLGKGKLSREGKIAILSAATQKYNEFGEKYATESGAMYDALKRQGGDPANVPGQQFSPFDPASLETLLPQEAISIEAQIAADKAAGMSREDVIRKYSGANP